MRDFVSSSPSFEVHILYTTPEIMVFSLSVNSLSCMVLNASVQFDWYSLMNACSTISGGASRSLCLVTYCEPTSSKIASRVLFFSDRNYCRSSVICRVTSRSAYVPMSCFGLGTLIFIIILLIVSGSSLSVGRISVSPSSGDAYPRYSSSVQARSSFVSSSFGARQTSS